MDFTKYFNKKIKITKLDKGITNHNYLTENGFIIKKYLNLVPNNEIKLYKLVKEFDVAIKEINREVKITKFYKDGTTLEDQPINKAKVIAIASLIKKLHDKKIKTDVIFDPRQIIDQYLKALKKPMAKYHKYNQVVIEAQNIYPDQKDLVLCHNDLTPGNFLFTKKKLFLIDWEYAGLNDPFFDVVSFLNENNLYDSPYKKLFIYKYFGKQKIDWDKIAIWNNFQNLMWAIWANMMYDLNPKKIYLDIWKYKMKNLEKHL